ncbi:MAG: hypothetical protein KAU20_03120 [Nanoarchaeota archaeon]|nr:hypothetical protein [Nanoarchaeota archaeon]
MPESNYAAKLGERLGNGKEVESIDSSNLDLASKQIIEKRYYHNFIKPEVNHCFEAIKNSNGFANAVNGKKQTIVKVTKDSESFFDNEKIMPEYPSFVNLIKKVVAVNRGDYSFIFLFEEVGTKEDPNTHFYATGLLCTEKEHIVGGAYKGILNGDASKRSELLSKANEMGKELGDIVKDLEPGSKETEEKLVGILNTKF